MSSATTSSSLPGNIHSNTVEVRHPEQYETQYVLSQLARRDFSYIRHHVWPKRFPESCERRSVYALPVVADMAQTLTYHYLRPPNRTFTPLPGESEFTERHQQSVTRFYAALGINDRLKALSRSLVHQRTVIGVMLPVGGSRKWSLSILEPWEFEVDPHPQDSRSIQRARAIRLRVPVSAAHDQVNYGILTMTPEQCYLDGLANRIGVFNLDPNDFSNPFTRLDPDNPYPAFVTRCQDPQPGKFVCHPAEDMKAANVELIAAVSDALFIAGNEAFGERVLKGADDGQPEKVKVGSDTVMGIRADQEYQILSSGADVGPYTDTAKMALEWTRMLDGLPASPMKSNALTALGKLMERVDTDAYSEDFTAALIRADNGAYRAARMVRAYNFGAPLPSTEIWPAAKVELEYIKPPVPMDPLHEPQAFQGWVDAGVTSAAARIAKKENVTIEEGQRRALEHRRLTRQLEMVEGGDDAP